MNLIECMKGEGEFYQVTIDLWGGVKRTDSLAQPQQPRVHLYRHHIRRDNEGPILTAPVKIDIQVIARVKAILVFLSKISMLSSSRTYFNLTLESGAAGGVGTVLSVRGLVTRVILSHQVISTNIKIYCRPTPVSQYPLQHTSLLSSHTFLS